MGGGSRRRLRAETQTGNVTVSAEVMHSQLVASLGNTSPPLPGGFEVFGRFWSVEARLGAGSSATVFQVSPGSGAAPTAVKEFLRDLQSGEYGFWKERTTLEELQGHRNIVSLYGVFTNALSAGGPTYCLLLELLDVSVSELLLHCSHQGSSMWMIQLCARDILEALSFIHREGYVHADLKPRNVMWSANEECFKLIDFGLSFKEGLQRAPMQGQKCPVMAVPSPTDRGMHVAPGHQARVQQ
ncbi:hypothetical protein FKM82_003847 [Ascaphus truei]